MHEMIRSNLGYDKVVLEILNDRIATLDEKQLMGRRIKRIVLDSSMC